MKYFSEWKKEFLSEGLSKIVYHGTSIDRLLSILKDDTILLTPTTSESDRLQNKFYYLSVSRIKYGGYMMSGDLKVNIVLDGQKLSNKYKGISVDYWGDEGDKSVKHKNRNTYMRNKRDENEDRLITNDDEIKNAHKYIKEIHIKTNIEDRGDISSNSQFDDLKEIVYYCESYNIPFYFYYKDDNDFKYLRNRNNELTEIFKNISSKKSKLANIIDLFNNKENINSPRDMEEYNVDMTDFTDKYRFKDLIKNIEDELGNIHYGSSYNTKDRLDRKLIKKYFDILRKFGVKSTKEFLIKLRDYFTEKFKNEDEE